MMKTPKSVLIVTSEFPPQPGGIGNHAYNLAKHLQLSHFDVEVISDQRSQDGVEEKQFDSTLSFKVYRVLKTSLRFRMYLKRIQLVFKHIETAQIVIASGKFSLWIVAFASIFYKRQYVAIIHGSEVNLQHRFYRFITNCSLKRFDQVIAVSRYTQSLVAHLGLKNVTVIPNAMDPNEWDLNAVEPVNLKGFPKLLTVGRLSDRKGQMEVIKHLPKLISIYPETHYHCVGLATESYRFMALAESLGVASYMTFHGTKTQAELKAFYQAGDVFVMLSRPTESGDVEGFGIAILEANYFGLPAIGSKGSGIEDAILDGDSGLLISYEDGAAFSGALHSILKDREGFETRAKAWALQHEWSSIVKRYVEVMEAVS